MKAKTGLFAIANKAMMLLGVLLVGLPSAGADSSLYILIESGQCDEHGRRAAEKLPNKAGPHSLGHSPSCSSHCRRFCHKILLL